MLCIQSIQYTWCNVSPVCCVYNRFNIGTIWFIITAMSFNPLLPKGIGVSGAPSPSFWNIWYFSVFIFYCFFSYRIIFAHFSPIRFKMWTGYWRKTIFKFFTHSRKVIRMLAMGYYRNYESFYTSPMALARMTCSCLTPWFNFCGSMDEFARVLTPRFVHSDVHIVHTLLFVQLLYLQSDV